MGSETFPKLTVIIPVKDRWGKLKLVLDGFCQQTLDSRYFQVILSDGGSCEDNINRIEDYISSAPISIKLLRGARSGRADARNFGILNSETSLLVFTDADIIPAKDFLQRHLEFHQNNSYPPVALLGIEVRVLNLEELETALEDPVKFLAEKPERASRRDRKFRKLQWWKCITGNLSLRRDLALQAGLFDIMFRGYGYEDIEFGYRLHKLGIEFVLDPKLFNFHIHPYTLEERLEVARYAGVNLAKFYLKHANPWIPLTFGINPINSFLAKFQGYMENYLKDDMRRDIYELRGMKALIFDLLKQITMLKSFYKTLTSSPDTPTHV